MKVAIVYDRVNKWGGAERVLLALHALFPKAPLYTSVYNPKTAPWAKVFRVKTSFLQKLRFARTHHELLPLLMPTAFERLSFDEYDLVISVTSEAAKGIITKGKTKHICYCLTPTRYLWSGYAEYFSTRFLRIVTAPVVYYLRKWDKLAANRPDLFIAISDEVQQRIKKYYGRDASVVYPPSLLTSKPGRRQIQTGKREKYFLIVSRLSTFTRYKRIDLAIRACKELGLQLKIVGTGNWEPELRAMAGPTVEFLGNLPDKELIKYYTNCQALIFPGKEDFGLTIVEAQYFGKPVIAYKAGGALETIIEGKTGEFFTPQTKPALKKVLESFRRKKYKEIDCKNQAEMFSFARFKREFVGEIERVMHGVDSGSEAGMTWKIDKKGNVEYNY